MTSRASNQPRTSSSFRPPVALFSPALRRPLYSVPLLALLTVLLVLVLPLFVPQRPVRGISASYLAGFNNTVAVLGATGLSVAVFLIVLLSGSRGSVLAEPTSPAGKLRWPFTAVVVCVSSAILAVACTLVTAAHQRYLGDAGYLIEQASTWNETGRHLYSQVEFAYGPLLLLPEIALARLLHLSMTAAYFTVLVLESALGLLMMAYLLNGLPIRPAIRKAALVLFALGAITPHLGLNYTFFRFGSPLALFFFAVRRGRSPLVTAALLSLAVVLVAAVSPELAFALAFGVVIYAGLRTWQEGAAWLLAGAIPLATLAALLVSVGHGYLRMIGSFTAGVYNLPVGPYPHIVILLVALVWLVPVALGRGVVLQTSFGAALLGLYTISLAMVSAALSRCDPLHVFFNGVGIFILSMVALSQLPHRGRVAAMACFALLVLWEHRVNEGLFSWRTAYTVRESVLPHTPAALRPAVITVTALLNRGAGTYLREPAIPQPVVDLPALYQIIGRDPVAAPLEIPPVMEAALKDSHHYAPLYRAFGVDMMDGTAERNTVTELAQFHWLLIPTQRNLGVYLQTPRNIGPIQGMRMYFRQRRAPAFVPGRIFEAGIARDWTPVQQFGIYTLYRRKQSM